MPFSKISKQREKGFPEGNALVKEILDMGFVSKYKMAKDLGVSLTQIYNWLKGAASPSLENFMKLKSYRLFMDKLKHTPKFDHKTA